MSYIQKVHEITKKIPRGRVTTYGVIAKALNINPRMVGYALHQNKDPNVPCHRVVNREGRLAPNFAGPQLAGAIATGRRAFDGWREQRRRLETEGITFKNEMHVDLKHVLN